MGATPMIRPTFSTLSATRVGADDERDGSVAPVRHVRYDCDGLPGRSRPHTFTVTLLADAAVPRPWRCRQHGITATTRDGEYDPPPEHDARTPVGKSHWDLLMERRGLADLAAGFEAVVAERRADGWVAVTEWLRVRHARRNAVPTAYEAAPRTRVRGAVHPR